jgi:alkyl sulfatase BDS1-like metallo-beta-lactamase superfamily hydrolase
MSGATELREGNFGTPASPAAPAVIAQLTPEQLFDSVAIAVDAENAWNLDLKLDWTITDLNTNYRLTLRNGVLVYVRKPASDGADAMIRISKPRMLALLGGDVQTPGIDITGDAGALQTLLAALDRPDPDFDIVTP